jgi:Sulfotransferase family
VLNSDSSPSDDPIFLVGAERSGTTVLRLMLEHHPKLAWCEEFEYAVDWISATGDFPPLTAYYDWLEMDRIFQATGFQIDQSLTYPQLINYFLAQKHLRDGKPLIGATVHRHFDRLLYIWQNARFIHLIRDPRDVARSCMGMGWAGNVWTGVERWIDAENLWLQLRDRIPADRYIDITYEALISDPTKVLTDLCNFIGIPYDGTMLKYTKSTTYDVPDPRFIGQWRHKLSNRDIQLIESRVADMLVERGYELSSLPKLDTSAIALGLRLQDWWARKQFRLRRYGFPLLLSDFLSRRLNRKSWQKQVRLKLNAIDTTYLK